MPNNLEVALHIFASYGAGRPKADDTVLATFITIFDGERNTPDCMDVFDLEEVGAIQAFQGATVLVAEACDYDCDGISTSWSRFERKPGESPKEAYIRAQNHGVVGSYHSESECHFITEGDFLREKLPFLRKWYRPGGGTTGAGYWAEEGYASSSPWDIDD